MSVRFQVSRNNDTWCPTLNTRYFNRGQKMKRLTKREKKIFLACLIVIISYGCYMGLWKPLKDKIDSLDQKIQTQHRRLLKDLRVIQDAQNIETSYNTFHNNFKQEKTNEQIMSSILSEIEEVAGQLALRISDLKPMRVKNEEFFNRFSVSLTIDSDLPGIVHFLYLLQTQPHLFDVESVRFDKGPERKVASIKTHLTLSKIFIP